MEERVNHPSHYKMDGRKECIDEMIDLYGIEAVKHFCQLNVYKYLYRHELKNGDEDLKKAEWYEKKNQELCLMEKPEKVICECHVYDCRYNSEMHECMNKEKRKECIDVANKVLCFSDDVFDDDLK